MQTMTPTSGEQLWKQCLQIIAGSCDPQTLQRWFAPIRPLGIETREDEQGRFEALVLEVPEILSPQGLEIYLTPAQTAQPAPQPKLARTQDYTSHLSADLRFETFYESACNREALRIAEATAARPGQAPLNFIFIYGPSGVGKTHLSQAIGQRAMELHPTMRVCYVSSSKFEAQFVRDSLMRGPERGMFVDFYQQMDMLIIDDIQGLIGKADSGVELGEECVEFIAESMQDNVRQLEGAIRTIITHSQFSDHGAVDLEATRRIVGGTVSIERREVTPESILDTVCTVFGVEKAQLRTPSRKAILALPRQVTMYLVKKHTNASYNTIAQLLNRNDHTTIMHGCKAIEGRLSLEPALKERIEQVEATLFA